VRFWERITEVDHCHSFVDNWKP